MIYVECKPDRVLVTTLGIPGTEIQHESNKVKVCKRLEKSLNCIGLVDEDPSSVQPTYIKRLEEKFHVHNIKLLYDKETKNNLIVLCPRLEVWILEAAQGARINLGNYDLPNSAEELHNVVNTKVGKFMILIQNIKKKKSKMLITLEDLLKTR
jgi:hypothetical protein